MLILIFKLLQYDKFNSSFSIGLNTLYSIIGIKKSSILYSILYIIKFLFSLILYASFNIFSHSPKLIVEISS